MPYSIQPYGPMKKLSTSSERKLDLFNFALKGKESSTTVSSNLRERTMEALLDQDAQSVANITTNLKKYVSQSLASAIRNGSSIAEAASSLLTADAYSHGPFARSRHAAMLIAKTELARARQQAIFDYYTSEGGYEYFVWISVRANNTCEKCRERHNKYKKLTTWSRIGIPPLHCGCKCCLVPGYSVPDSAIPENYEEV